jgi:hypothetical protein
MPPTIKQREPNTYTRNLPHGVCGTFEFYTTTSKCVFCCRRFASERKQKLEDYAPIGTPKMDIKMARIWATIPLR